MSIQTYRFCWHDGFRDIEIEVNYTPLKWSVISHFEIRSLKPERAALPITGTGYLSHHFHPDSVDFEETSVVDFITDWLDKDAAKPEWKEHVGRTRQYELF